MKYRVSLKSGHIGNISNIFYPYRLNMCLLKEERIELALFSRHERWSSQKILDVLNACHPRWDPIGFSIAGKVVRNFNVDLIHRVHINLIKPIKLYIPNGGESYWRCYWLIFQSNEMLLKHLSIKNRHFLHVSRL